MQFLHMIAEPMVGAVIGYCTNYIAVKMLFRPLKPIQIGGHTLPFTPGIIPKRKPALAKALGKAVGTTLLTAEDIKMTLLSEKMQETVTDMLFKQIDEVMKSEATIQETALNFMNEGNYMQLTGKLSETVINKIMENIEQFGIGDILVEEAKKVVKEKFSGSLMSMFMSDDLIDSIAKPIGEAIENYINENGRDYIEPAVIREISAMEQVKICDLAEGFQLNYNKMKEQISEIYVKCIENSADKLMGQFQIEKIVEQKVNEMDVLEVEELVLSVMKKELNMIINLGAMIGFVLGITNLFI